MERLRDLDDALDALGVLQLLPGFFGKSAGEHAPLAEVVGVPPLPEVELVTAAQGGLFLSHSFA
jgi:hypothetical protein